MNGRERDERAGAAELQGSATAPDATWRRVHVSGHLAKPTECVTPRENPKLQVLGVMGLRVLNDVSMSVVNQRAAPVCVGGVLIKGRPAAGAGQGVHGKYLYFPSNFAVT